MSIGDERPVEDVEPVEPWTGLQLAEPAPPARPRLPARERASLTLLAVGTLLGSTAAGLGWGVPAGLGAAGIIVLFIGLLIGLGS